MRLVDLQKKDFDEAYLAECVWAISENAYPYGSPWTKMQFLTDIQQPPHRLSSFS